MPSKRLARLNEQLRREIAELLRTSVRDPRVGDVTVTAVQVVTDLAHARVHVHLPGGATEKEATLEGLRAAAPFLRRTLGKALHVRRIPELHFVEDTSLKHAQRIEAILAEVLPPASEDDDEGDLKAEGEEGAGGDGGDGDPEGTDA